MTKGPETHEIEALRFRPHMRVGAADAEHDTLLQSAFYDTGFLQVLANVEDARCLVIGRTGSGKTAVLRRLEDIEGQERCIRINPEALSLRYVGNSTILPELTRAGVHLDVFYKLLWRHVLVVELVRRRFNLYDPQQRELRVRQWLDGITHRGRVKRQSVEYLEQFGAKFWEESELVVRHVVQKMENDLTAELGVKSSFASARLGASEKGQLEIGDELRNRAQDFVNGIQIEKLHTLFSVLRDDVLDDPARRFYLLVDDLDKNWVDSAFAYDLINALLAEAAEFAQLPNVKVIVAIRENILHMLYGQRKRGQQREKVETLCVRLRWSPAQLVSMLDARLQTVFKDIRGTPVTLPLILPDPRESHLRSDPTKYILERTALRPRDLIHFVNDCLEAASGKDKITWKDMAAAEAKYSQDRLQSLEDEWGENFPKLGVVLLSLRGVPDRFTMADFPEDCVIRILDAAGEAPAGSVPYLLRELDRRSPADYELKDYLVRILFQVGAVGIKASPQDPVEYSYQAAHYLESAFPSESVFYIHPALKRALAVDERSAPPKKNGPAKNPRKRR